jgi:hypothetical protein
MRPVAIAFACIALLAVQASAQAPPPADNAITVLWPRIIPSADAAAFRVEALGLQSRLKETVQKVLPGRPLDVRPEPERSCSHGQCPRLTVGVLLLHKENGCAAVALIYRPNGGVVSLAPWAGDLKLKATQVQPGEPPENQVTIRDFVPCNALLKSLDAAQPGVDFELREAAAPKK